MSRVSMTLCDGCGKELKENQGYYQELCLIVTLAKTKMTEHFCYQCATPLIEKMNQMADERIRKRGEKQDG